MTMEELIRKALAENKWLWCRYQDLWFKPNELAEAQANGKFRWGPVNWEMRDPQERIKSLEEDVKRAKSTLENFKART